MQNRYTWGQRQTCRGLDSLRLLIHEGLRSKECQHASRAIRSSLDFSKIPTAIKIPNLIEVQRKSYERFLQMDKLPAENAKTADCRVRVHQRVSH